MQASRLQINACLESMGGCIALATTSRKASAERCEIVESRKGLPLSSYSFLLLFEELHQYGDMRFRSQHVRLPLERLVPPVRQYACQRPVPVTHPRRAFPTIHDECRYCDGCPMFGRQRLASLVVSYYRAIVGQRMRDGFKLRPHRHQRHHGDKEGRNTDQIQKELDRLAAPICRNRLGDPGPIALCCGTAVVHDEWCLVQRQLLDPTEAICCLKRKNCARGMPQRNAAPPASLNSAAMSSISRSTA